MKVYQKLLLFFLFAAFSNLLFGQSISGHVTDKKTGEAMIGATVILKNTNRKQIVKLDGNFQFKNLEQGNYNIEVSYQNYKSYVETVALGFGEHKKLEITLEENFEELNEITISTYSGTDNKTRDLEKRSEPLVNILSSKTIQLLPDITVANALQRVSGVTIEKSSSGEGRYPIIRGMEKRYINTLVNGIKIPSPDNKSRFVPMDLFPSELLERLEVNKSLTPAMEGDAIGGTINLVMKDAPPALLLHANASVGYNTTFTNQPFQKFCNCLISKQSPYEKNGSKYVPTISDFGVAQLNYTTLKNPVNTTFGLTAGNRFGKQKRFGLILSGSYQDLYRGATSNFFLPNSQPTPNNTPAFSELQLRHYSVHSQRLGISGKLDYQINNNNKISFTNTYVKLNDFQTRIVYDTVTLNSVVDNWQRSQWQYQSIYNSTLQGIHKLAPHFKTDWSLVYSIANNHIPQQSQFIHQYPIVATDLTADKLQKMTQLWLHNSDRDFSGYLNFTKNFNLLDRELELKFGGVLRNKTRDNFYSSYTLDPVLNALYTNINTAQFMFNAASGNNSNPAANGNNYTFNENISAGYAQAKLQLLNRLEMLGGVRIEHTYQKYDTKLGTDVDAKSGTIQYTDVLPSVQFKYAFTSNKNLRLSYYKALARPGFAEMIPDGIDGEFFKEIGNPQKLNHTTADNFDLRYEMYFKNTDQVLLGAFYKKIQNPIEISAVKPQGVNSLYLMPVNIGSAANYGFEAVVTKYFGYFGISANYTYTNSKITNDSMISKGESISTYVSETRPLQGQSKHIGNVSVLFKDPRIGFDFQAALVYTGERINFVSPYVGLHYWQSPTTQLDISFEKRLVKKLSVYGKINNITNAPFELYLKKSYNDYIKAGGSRPLALQTDPSNKIIIEHDYYKTTYLLGIRFKL